MALLVAEAHLENFDCVLLEMKRFPKFSLWDWYCSGDKLRFRGEIFGSRRCRLLLSLLSWIFLLTSALMVSAKPGDVYMNRPYADLRPWHLGFSVGMQFQDLSFMHNGFITESGEQWVMGVPDFQPGVTASVMGNLRVSNYLSLRLSPGLYFGAKRVKMRDSVNAAIIQQDVKSAYLAIPIDMKISGDRYFNLRPYLTVGPMATFEIGKRRSEYLKFKTLDLYLCLGAGIEEYLPYFKFIPEIKFCFGLTDVLEHNRLDLAENPEMQKITKSLSKVTSNMILVTFYFE